MDLDREIFEAAESPSPSPGPLVDEATAVRDSIKALQREGGRDAPQAREPGPQAPPQAPQHGVEDQSPAGILQAMLNERERRQGLERQLERYQRWEQEQAKKAQESETPFDQRFFSQPQQELESFVTQRLTPLEQRQQNFMTDVDMRLARIQHGEVFDEAFQTWFQQVGDQSRPDPHSYFAVMNSPSPGEALMAWFEDQGTRKEIGQGGLKAYRERVRQEVMAELGMAPRPPVNMGPPDDNRARESNGQFAPRHEVRLPTSLSRLGAAGRGTPSPMEDGSEEAIFDAGRPERRR
jgi:hypothetical protein